MINDMITSSLKMIVSSLKYTLCCETFCLNHRKTEMSQKKKKNSQPTFSRIQPKFQTYEMQEIVLRKGHFLELHSRTKSYQSHLHSHSD